jgi:trans-aconitate methyltransferase
VTREQRTVFGEVAELYERTRPGYPDALFETVLQYAGIEPGSRALEIGAGTGKATRGFAARGLDILALEPSPGMAEVLRRSHPSVLETTFEDWVVEPGAFALLYAAQSWHWVVDHAAACTRAAEVLRPRGTVALFWNLPQQFDGALGDEIEAVYRELAPSLEPMTTQWPLDETLAELEASGCFERVTKTTLQSAQTYTTDDYVELMGTHSNHRMLDGDTLSRLQHAVCGVLTRHGSQVDVHYEVALYLGSRS